MRSYRRRVASSEIVQEKGSRFQAFGARVKTCDEADRVIEHIKNQTKNKLATHNIFAYRIDEDDIDNPFESCHDDDEKSAGGRVLRVLQYHKVRNTVVVVARWYGGEKLYNKRFQIIRDCTMNLLDKMNLLDSDVKEDDRHTDSKPSGNEAPVDHLILHDSTGNHIEASMFSGKGQTTVKSWAPYIDMATTIVQNRSRVSKSITILIGVRHLRQYISRNLSISQYRERMERFVQAARSTHPTAKIVLCSILPDSTPDMIEGAAMLNSILTDMTDDINVVYADTQSKLAVDAMDGVHPRKTHIRHLVTCIKQHLRPKRQLPQKDSGKNKTTQNNKLEQQTYTPWKKIFRHSSPPKLREYCRSLDHWYPPVLLWNKNHLPVLAKRLQIIWFLPHPC